MYVISFHNTTLCFASNVFRNVHIMFFGVKCSKTGKKIKCLPSENNICIWLSGVKLFDLTYWIFWFSGNRPNTGRKKKRYKSFQFAPVNPNHKKPGRRDLVYFDSSPSYCEKDTSIDFPGTYGRECNATSIGIDGCDLLCCGRGYVSKSYMVRERCSCIFRWCCDVKCEVCTRTKVLHTCK